MANYSIEVNDDRVVIRGSLPIGDLAALQKGWKKQGIDAIPMGVTTALGATLAVCRKDDVDAWTQEVNQHATALSSGDAELEWLLGADTGTSSKTMFSVLASAEMLRTRCRASLGYAGVPHDPADFGRCHRLLEKFPAWRERLNDVAEAFPKWAAFVREWEQMTALYLEELPKKSCPKLYDLMKTLRSGALSGDSERTNECVL